MRIKISRKEAKEAQYWLRLLDLNEGQEMEKERTFLVKEAVELMMIFGSILQKSQ